MSALSSFFSGGIIPWTIISANTTLSYFKRYAVLHTAPVTLTLPPTSTVGQWIKVSDVAGVAETHNITITAVGGNQLLENSNGSFTLDANYASVELVVTTSGNWRVSIG